MPSDHDVLTAAPAERLDEILDRLRAYAGTRVVVDCRAHAGLRLQGIRRRLLARAASELGKEVSFAMGNGGAAPHRRLEVPSASALDVAHGPRRRTSASLRGSSGKTETRLRPPLTGWSIFAFAFLAGGMLTSVVLFVLPRADIIVTVAAEPLVADLSVSLDATATAPDAARGVHPARIARVSGVRQVTVPVSTVAERGDRATGTVVLVNRTGSPQGIRRGTRLESSGGVVLRTLRDAIVPAGGPARSGFAAGDAGGSMPVAVRADAGGVRGNLETQRLVLPALAPAVQSVLWAAVTEPLSGGTDRPVRVVSDADVDRATGQLRAEAESALRASVDRASGEGEPVAAPKSFLHPDLRRVVLEQRDLSSSLGAETDAVTVSALVRAEAMTTDTASLETFLNDLVAARAGEGRVPASRVRPDELRVVDVRWESGRVLLSLHVETETLPALAAEKLSRQLEGRTASEAVSFLRALAGVHDARVQLSPSWVRRVPGLQRNVRVRLERFRPLGLQNPV